MKSEAELDSQLAGLHYRIEHESISLNEEKKAMATIKKLEQQRERVRSAAWCGASMVAQMAAAWLAAAVQAAAAAGESWEDRHNVLGCHVPVLPALPIELPRPPAPPAPPAWLCTALRCSAGA